MLGATQLCSQQWRKQNNKVSNEKEKVRSKQKSKVKPTQKQKPKKNPATPQTVIISKTSYKETDKPGARNAGESGS